MTQFKRSLRTKAFGTVPCLLGHSDMAGSAHSSCQRCDFTGPPARCFHKLAIPRSVLVQQLSSQVQAASVNSAFLYAGWKRLLQAQSCNMLQNQSSLGSQ